MIYMRRRGYPYGRYLLKGKNAGEEGPKLKDFMENMQFSVVKYDEKNEGVGTLLIAVNKKVEELIKEKKPSGRLLTILTGYSIPSFRDMDTKYQRVGVEVYLWPVDEGLLLELFVLPYMERLDKFEIFGLTESEEEEITDWFLCEQTWEHIEPQIVEKFDAEPVHRRA